MKILIFGIDGLGKSALEGLGLKRLAARMEQGQVGNPSIHNIISRGWPEIYTGKDAYETGGFYQVPEYKNGKIFPTQNTGLSTIKKIIGEDDLLWNVLNKLGYKVGIFTVPTVSKPEEIDGFCVAATGAGKFGNDVTEDDLYPKNLLDGLHIKDIDLGFRMGYGAFIPDSIQDLELNANKHIADYFYSLERVLEKNPVDICFAASRFINEMGYKFLGLCLSEPNNQFENELKLTVLALCDNFDAKLDSFISKVNPQHCFIVSDHGIGKYEYDLNLNELLLKNKLIQRNHSFEIAFKGIIKKLIFQFSPKMYGPVTPKYNLDKADFFSIGYMNVLYLKDQRFGGKARSVNDALIESKEMADKLNNWAKAAPLDEYIRFKAIKKEHYVGINGNKIPNPNIICEINDGISNSERSFEAFSKKEYYYSEIFKRGFFGEHSGCKTKDTLASYSGNLVDQVDLSSLTTVYHSIVKVAKNKAGKQ